MQYFNKWLILILLLFVAGGASAQHVAVLSNQLKGSQIVNNAYINVRDADFFDTDASKLNSQYSVMNFVNFHIDEYSSKLLPDSFTAILKVRIVYMRTDEQLDSLEQSLVINYSDTATYTSQRSFVFNNSHNVTVRVLGLSISRDSEKVLPSLVLDNIMNVQAVYNLNCTDDAVKSVYSVATANTDSTDELTVKWAQVNSADEYDVEWRFLDTSAIASGRYGSAASPDPSLIFRNNASRVTVSGYSYNIPLMFEGPGVLYFRVRAVQVMENDARIVTSWSSAFSGGMGSFEFVGHQGGLNWQSNIAFAEEGKRNVSVTYYDGSLRGRQTVTKDNTTNTTVVSETLYDYQGRPTINIMPAPTLGTAIKYSANFNQGLNNAEYDKTQYDNLAQPSDFLTASAPAMSSASGANQYYSPDNPKKDEGMNRYIPDAGGYAFTETVYAQDGTDRISRQSGVGETFKLGSNHETKYFYGSPNDNDLDMLFGTEAGDRLHYFKNSVQDANGQMKVSYVDMHGRTVATALAGRPDSADLDDLESNIGYVVIDTLSRAGSNTIKGSVLESSHSQLVALSGPYHFRYALQPPVLRKPDCNNDTICYNGLYDLEIIITDDVYNQHLGGKPFDTIIHNYNADAIIANCTTPDSMVVDFTLNLPKGSYQITKRLTVNSAALSYYRDNIFMKKNVCRTLEEFIQVQRNLLTTTQCVPDCQTCRDSLGDWNTFRANYMLRGGVSPSDSASYRGAALTAYADASAACDALCNTTSPVAEKKESMLQDLTAPSGQYAMVDDSSYVYSIYYHKDDTVLPPFKKTEITYLDEAGNVDSVYDDSQGIYVLPQQLPAETFAEKFKPSWAAALFPYHPEYCRYQVYASYESSLNWNTKFEACNTYSDALKAGYLNPIGDERFPFTIVRDNVDPLAASSSLYGKLNNYTGASGTNALSMYSVATILTKCTDISAACVATYNTPATAFDSTALCAGDLDMAWRTFRQLYLAYKNHVIDSLVMKASCTPTSAKLIADGKTPNFLDTDDAYTLGNIDYVTGNKDAAKDSVDAGIQASYEANCNAYISMWMSQLSACINYDTADVRLNLIPKLKAICLAGSDEQHVMGASSTPSGDNSFQKEIEAYNKAKGINDALNCNGLLVTAPAPYDKQRSYSDVTTYAKPTQCECENLLGLQREYNTFKRSSDTTLAAYLNRTRSTTLTETQVSLLLESCDATKASCTYMSSQLVIPSLIQCNAAPACVTCQVVSDLYAQYKATYPGIEPTAEEPDSLQQKKNQLFAAYMNNGTGYNYEAWRYLAFMDTCKLYVSKDTSVCTPVNSSTSIQTYTNGVKALFYDIVNTADGGLLLAGQVTNSSTTNPTDAYLVKTDAKGQLEWAKSYAQGTGLDFFNKIRPTKDSGYIIIGTTVYKSKNSAFVVKIDKAGTVIWSKALYLAYDLAGQDIVETPAGGYAVAIRYNTSSNHVECVLAGLDSTGAGVWGRILSLVANQANEGFALVPKDDSLVVFGCSNANLFGGTVFNVWLAKVSMSTGEVLKSNFYAKQRPSSAEGNYSAQLYKTSYGYLFNMTATNPATTNRTDSNMVVGVNEGGNVVFAKQFSNPFEVNATQWMPICPTSDGGIMTVQNFSTSPAQVVWQKVDANRQVAWSELVKTEIASDLHSVKQLSDGSYAAVGNYGDYGMLMMSRSTEKIGCNDSLFVNDSRDIPMDTNSIAKWGRNDDIKTSVLPNTYAITPTVTDLTSSTTHGSVNCSYGSCYTMHDGPLLCGNATPVFAAVPLDSSSECTDDEYYAISVGTNQYNVYRDSLYSSFGNEYLDTALAGGQREVFTLTYTNSEYHYTLYYYDQAGNLLKTVPPAGVVIDRTEEWAGKVKAARALGEVLVPAHKMVTQFRYNTLNQVIAQISPDGGLKYFWYDRLGRLVFSQNANQALKNAYSYTNYDALGRITEVGEITSATAMNGLISRDTSRVAGWMAAAKGTRTQINMTNYDVSYEAVPAAYLVPENLRNRVSWVAVFNDAAAQDTMGFAMASFYSYDIHGNVKTLLNDYKQGSLSKYYNRWKKTQYKYDLISGKVNWIGYQAGKKDAFYHRYSYDAQNRITNVETSQDSVYWENDAYYEYYKHGALARTVIGQQQVQGLDYAYTLQGWLKGVNSTAGTALFDMGGDGNSGSQVAKDVFGFGLHYYGIRDYSPVNAVNIPFAAAVNLKPIFTGNIAGISQHITPLGTPLEYVYSYDALNRMKGMTANKGMDSLNNSWTNSFTALPDFKETVSYDANGNIVKYKRNGNNTFAGTPLEMDNLTYDYRPGTNKLNYVKDSVDADNYSNDIDNQLADNYQYDSVGNLISDRLNGIDSISWNVYGKIAKIYKKDSTVISFTYDGSNNRISKTVGKTQTWYVRDLTGNVISIYTYGDTAVNNGQLSQTEAHLYGSGRLGLTTMATNVQDTSAPAVINITGLGLGRNVIFTRGNKYFELSNHLGNVLATISDRKKGVSLDNSTIDHYEPVVSSAQEYYPFGLLMPGRRSGGYRYGFNGKENDNEIKGDGNTVDFGARMYDPAIGRWFSADPLREVYTSLAPYSYGAGNPVNVLDGEGNILKDKDGNIIATSTGTYAPNTVETKSNFDEKTGISTSEFLYRKYEVVHVYADDGTPVDAMRLVESYVRTIKVKGMTTISSTDESLDKHGYEAVSDCHGYTFAKGKLWINDDQVNTVLDHDDYTKDVPEKKATAVIFKNGKDVVHSAERNKSGTYSNDAGFDKLEKNVSLKKASRDLTDIKVPGNVLFVKKNTPDKQLDITSGTVVGGVRYTSAEEVTKALAPPPAPATAPTPTTSAPAFKFNLQVKPSAANATSVKKPAMVPIK